MFPSTGICGETQRTSSSLMTRSDSVLAHSSTRKGWRSLACSQRRSRTASQTRTDKLFPLKNRVNCFQQLGLELGLNHVTHRSQADGFLDDVGRSLLGHKDYLGLRH